MKKGIFFPQKFRLKLKII